MLIIDLEMSVPYTFRSSKQRTKNLAVMLQSPQRSGRNLLWTGALDNPRTSGPHGARSLRRVGRARWSVLPVVAQGLRCRIGDHVACRVAVCVLLKTRPRDNSLLGCLAARTIKLCS